MRHYRSEFILSRGLVVRSLVRRHGRIRIEVVRMAGHGRLWWARVSCRRTLRE